VLARILHVSDLHVGAGDDSALEDTLRDLTARVEPALVLASGDLTHRGRPGQHDRAAAALQGLGVPVLAVPGNHDIPYAFPARFSSPWREFDRCWETTEPTYSAGGLHVVGLNSVRPWRHQSGGVDDGRLLRAAQRLRAAPAGSLRVAVLHHQLIGAPWRTRKRPVAHRNRVLGGLIDAGAELIVGGHIHQAAVAERFEFEVVAEGVAGGVVSIAPGLGRPRPNRRGEASGALIYAVDDEQVTVETLIRSAGSWRLAATRTFPRRRETP
jgi:3',5'-cyclic AMP phosphodiesterase CpdA